MLGLLMVIYVGSSVVKFVLGLDQSYCINLRYYGQGCPYSYAYFSCYYIDHCVFKYSLI